MANALPPLVLPANTFIGNTGSADAQAAAVPLATLAALLQLSNFPYSDAGGTADAITATYSAVATLYDGLTVAVGIATVNATTTPTFAPTINGSLQTARTIVKYLGNARVALAIGDLQGIAFLTYDLGNTVWILTNPSEGGKATVVSGTTPDIFNAPAPTINYTGTGTCTGFVSAPKAGMTRKLICADACLFTAGANLLIEGIPSGTTITLAANAIVDVVAITTTQFKMTYSLSGTFTVTGTGFTANPTDTANYTVQNGVIMIGIPANLITGTSNATTFTLTGLPACVYCKRSGSQVLPLLGGRDNSVYGSVYASIAADSGTITLYYGAYATGWTASGTKSLLAAQLVYHV